MKKRDTFVLILAILCGLLAFSLVMKILKKSNLNSTLNTMTIGANGKIGPLPIPSGMSALTLYFKDIESVPDLLRIGSYVDMLGVAPNYEGKMELQAIVRSAQVINLDKKDASTVDSITLALTSTAAEVASKAMSQGKIHLILRPDSGDKGTFQFNGLGFTEVIRGVEKDKSVHAEK